MQKTIFFFLLMSLFFVSCSSDSSENTAEAEAVTREVETTKKAASTPSWTTSIGKPAAVSVKTDGKTIVTSTESPSLQIIDDKGNVSNIEMTQPTIVAKSSQPNTGNKKPITTKEIEKSVKAANASNLPATVEDIPMTQPKITSSSAANKATSSTIPKKEEVEPINIEIQQPKATVNEVKKAPAEFSHKAWDGLLQKYVSSAGKVNYAGFKKDKAALDAYTAALAANPIQSSWSKAKQMAYWINAYNAFTVKMIVDNYPISSITKLDGGKPWDKKWIKIGGKTYSLNNIENDILRPQYKDARIHFAVNCAAKSCPPLLNRAWTASNLESNFERQAKAFINNASFNKVSTDKVEVSKIFEWYAKDFGDLISYLNKYASTKIDAKAKIKYMEYDWALNE